MSKGLSFALGDRLRIRACAVRRDSRERAFAQRVVATTLGVLRVADQLLLLSARDRVEQFYQKPIPGGCPPDNRTLSRLRDCGAARVLGFGIKPALLRGEPIYQHVDKHAHLAAHN
jgi:hypothetical protein